MPYGKRRKGKQGDRTPHMLSMSGDEDEKQTDEGMNGIQEGEPRGSFGSAPADHPPSTPRSDSDLILTSEKRRGVYECDYCHSDISQLPRMRCAICPDFDLCLDCFLTTDHSAAIARLRAVASTHDAIHAETGATSTSISGISSAALNHTDSHGYRVCDSTRYPLFPTARSLLVAASKATQTPSIEEKSVEPSAESTGKVEQETKSADDPMEVDAPVESSTETTTDAKPETNLETTQEAPTFIPKSDAIKTTESLTPKAKSDATASVADDDLQPAGALTSLSEIKGIFCDGTQQPRLNFEDPRNVWTVEEDLRLIEGIRTHGLGNWTEISEAVSGPGSVGKTPKRCMERFFDDFCGRYGHILPPYSLEMEASDEEDNAAVDESKSDEAEAQRASKRRSVLLRSPSTASAGSMASRKRFKVKATESLPGYDKVWPLQYVPPVEGVEVGQEVGRDQSYKAEQLFVKTVSQLQSVEEVAAVRKEWEEKRLLKPGGPTALPFRPEDLGLLPGAELAGFMPRRGDFDVEWENDAEQAIADMEFLPGDSEQDRELKLKVLAIYNSRLDEREQRKKFVMNRGLYDYRKNQMEEQKLPRDERDLIHRMRLFARFHTPEEHNIFISDLLKAKRLRKEIAKLQMYRRIGIRTVAEAEMYELDKARRSFHRSAQLQKEAEAAKTADGSGLNDSKAEETASSSLWKQYRTTDRKVRKSINRGSSQDELTDPKGASEGNPSTEATEAMQANDQPSDTATPADEAPSIAGEVKEEKDELATMANFHLLSEREADLCRKLQLTPNQYLEVKKTIIHQSFTNGLLDKESSLSSRRTLVKIDAKREGDIVNFLVEAGWISSKLPSS